MFKMINICCDFIFLAVACEGYNQFHLYLFYLLT